MMMFRAAGPWYFNAALRELVPNLEQEIGKDGGKDESRRYINDRSLNRFLFLYA